MRILVIGGTQFIGPPVVRELVPLGHEVTVFHRGEHEADLPAEVRHVHSAAAGIPVTRFPGELRRWTPEVVLHMFPIGERDAQTLMDAFRGVARRMVGISSGDVYRAYGVLRRIEPGPPEPMPLTEDSPLRQVMYPYRGAPELPEWTHEYEKILVERVIMGDPELPGTILRLPMVYGPGDLHHRIGGWIKQMQGRKVTIGSDQRFQYGYVDDVAHAIALAVCDDRAAGRVYNVGSPQIPSTSEFIRLIGNKVGWQGEIAVLANDAGQDLVYDTSRIRRELGYRALVSFDEGLERTIEWERGFL